MIDVLILDESHILYEGKAERIHFRGQEGEFEVAQNHMPILSLLEKGTIHIVGQTAYSVERRADSGQRGADSVERIADRKLNAKRYTLNALRIPIERGIMKMEQNRVLVMVEG